MLIRKIGRQPSPMMSALMRSPPRIGPETEASPAVSAKSPKAEPRCSGVKSSGTSASVWGVISAAPTDCSTRAATSVPMPGANPQSSEASVKTPTPTMNSIRRPKRSPIRPAGSSSSAKGKV
nr:hypothetical protein [Salipiger mucosus]